MGNILDERSSVYGDTQASGTIIGSAALGKKGVLKHRNPLLRNATSQETVNYACRFSLATISAVKDVPVKKLQSPTRSSLDISCARQIAMYLAHTKFGISFADVGKYFDRDRSTVAHACQVIEKQRDDKHLDEHICRMEYLIDAALPNSIEVQRVLASRFVGGLT